MTRRNMPYSFGAPKLCRVCRFPVVMILASSQHADFDRDTFPHWLITSVDEQLLCLMLSLSVIGLGSFSVNKSIYSY